MSALIPPGLDLRCDHCGEPVESDNDLGNEDFRHTDDGYFSCGGNGETCATVDGNRKVAAWRAARDAAPNTPKADPDPTPDRPLHEVAWIREGLEWAVANGVEVHIVFRAGPR